MALATLSTATWGHQCSIWSQERYCKTIIGWKPWEPWSYNKKNQGSMCTWSPVCGNERCTPSGFEFTCNIGDSESGITTGCRGTRIIEFYDQEFFGHHLCLIVCIFVLVLAWRQNVGRTNVFADGCNRLTVFFGFCLNVLLVTLQLLLVNMIFCVCILCRRCMCTWGLTVVWVTSANQYSQKRLSFWCGGVLDKENY